MSTCHSAWICQTRHQQKHHQVHPRCPPSNNLSIVISPQLWWHKDQSTSLIQSKTLWLRYRGMTWGRTSLLMFPLQTKGQLTLQSAKSANKNLDSPRPTSVAVHTCLFYLRPQVLRANQTASSDTWKKMMLSTDNWAPLLYTSHVIYRIGSLDKIKTRIRPITSQRKSTRKSTKMIHLSFPACPN